MPPSTRARIRYLKHEAHEAGDKELESLCIIILETPVQLYSRFDHHRIECEVENPIIEWVRAVEAAINSDGHSIYRGHPVYSGTY